MRAARVAALLALSSCATGRPLTPAETLLLAGPAPVLKLDLTRPDPSSPLRRRSLPVDPGDPGVARLVDRLRASLEETQGLGIAAPQLGVLRRAVLVRHGTRPAATRHVEVYLNPVVEWRSAEVDDDWEADLSIDGVGGLVRRSRAVRVVFQALDGSRQTVEADGWDGRILQHELDHLDGVLFVDRLVGELLPLEEMRRRRDEGHRARGWLPP